MKEIFLSLVISYFTTGLIVTIFSILYRKDLYLYNFSLLLTIFGRILSWPYGVYLMSK